MPRHPGHATTPAIPTDPHGAASRALRIAGLAAIALVTLGLGVYALLVHRVGDYLTESDFYGGYAIGARALRDGSLDFGRYGVYGPVYEALLALAGIAVPDLFTAARLLSVLAAGVTLAAWWRIAERRLDALAALLLVVALAANPTFVRYGYSATTDLTGMALFSLAVCASLTGRGPRAPFWTGVAAGLATLTRYNLLSLVPAALVVEALRPGRTRAARARAMALVLAGVALTLVPWSALSLRAGHLPGATLLSDRGFYLQTAPGGALEDRYRDLDGASPGAPDAPAPDPVSPLAWAARLGGQAADHVVRDARDLLGPPASALALAGLIAMAVARRWALAALLAPFAVFPFAVLVPVFHTERYSMVIAPILLLPAVGLLSGMARARSARPLPALAAAALGLMVLVPSVQWSLVYHRGCRAAMPLETREAGRVLRAVANPWDRLLARKAHTAYYSGLVPVPFPAVATLPELADYCHERSVRYLYFSWYEARMRPDFAYLLDTSVAFPGLRVVHVTRDRPSVTYRVLSDFGHEPAWWGEGATRERVALRVNALIQPGGAAVPFLLSLAALELRSGLHDAALADARSALHLAPEHPEALRLEAQALRSIAARMSGAFRTRGPG